MAQPPRGNNNQNLKGIHAIGSEIIDATDGRTTDDGQRPHTMNSADKVYQAELKNCLSVWSRGSNNQNLKEIRAFRFRDNCDKDG